MPGRNRCQRMVNAFNPPPPCGAGAGQKAAHQKVSRASRRCSLPRHFAWLRSRPEKRQNRSLENNLRGAKRDAHPHGACNSLLFNFPTSATASAKINLRCAIVDTCFLALTAAHFMFLMSICTVSITAPVSPLKAACGTADHQGRRRSRQTSHRTDMRYRKPPGVPLGWNDR